MAAIMWASAPRPARIVMPSTWISMMPASGLGLHRVGALRSSQRAGAAATASTTAGTNSGASALVIEGLRACRRHVNTCCGISPWRRATSETTAPGKSVSSTISALSSSENRRRRPVPVITSSRRTVTSGSSVWSSVDTSRSLFRDRYTRPSQAPREGGVRTALTNLRELIEKNKDIDEAKRHDLLTRLADFEGALDKKRLNLV